MKKFFKRFTLLGFDRSFSKGLLFQLLWLLGIMCVVYIVLAAVSYFGQLYVSNGPHNRYIDILLALIGFGSKSKAMSFPLTVVCAILSLIIFSGMLISVISNMLKRRVEQFTKGETNYKFSNHVVVLGFNKSIPSLLKELHKDFPDSYIVIMCNQNVADIRDWIRTNVNEKIEDAIILMNGLRNAHDDLKRLRLDSDVKEIYILGEPDEPAHDETSLECVSLIAKKINVDENLSCYVQINSNSMFSILQKTIPDEIKIKEADGNEKRSLNFIPFNFNEIWAQKVMATVPDDYYLPLDGDGITPDSDKRVHFVIIGMNKMSHALAVNAAHVLHFPNYKNGQPQTGSTITFIDSDAGMKGEEFRSRYRNLFSLSRWRFANANTLLETDKGWHDPFKEMADSKSKRRMGETNFMDIQWEFVEAQPSADAVMTYLDTNASDCRSVVTIALCLEQTEDNISLCMSLPETVRLKANEILVRENESDKAVTTLQKIEGFKKIRAFGMMNQCYQKNNLMSDKFGKLINACFGKNKKIIENEKEKDVHIDIDITDDAKVDEHWKETTIINQWSSIFSGNMLFYKLRAIGLKTNLETELTEDEVVKATEKYKIELAMLEHNRWNTTQLIMGFRPLATDEEIEKWGAGGKNLLRDHFIHGDIRMFKVLSKDDVKKDENVTSKLYLLYKLAKKDLLSKKNKSNPDNNKE